MIYRTVEGFQTEKPKELDTESSRTTVYLRRNIEEVPNTDMNGDIADGFHWQYEEARLTKDEYKIYSGIMEENKKIKDDFQSKIDYLAIMGDVEM